MANPRTYRIALEEITARNQTARHMIAGFAADMPTLAEFWRNLDTALADNLALSAEVTQLTAELATTRLDRANLLAAIRASLAAYGDGEADPFWYLRDELHARQSPSQLPAVSGGDADGA
jgi:predicted DNA-binding ribbon-helix-helix protein